MDIQTSGAHGEGTSPQGTRRLNIPPCLQLCLALSSTSAAPSWSGSSSPPLLHPPCKNEPASGPWLAHYLVPSLVSPPACSPSSCWSVTSSLPCCRGQSRCFHVLSRNHSRCRCASAPTTWYCKHAGLGAPCCASRFAVTGRLEPASRLQQVDTLSSWD